MTSFFKLAAPLIAVGLLGACSDAVDVKPVDVAALHDRILTLDTHIDIPLTYMTEIDPSGPTDLQVDLPKLSAGKLDSGFWIVYTPQADLTPSAYDAAYDIAKTRIDAIGALVTTHASHFELAKTAADVRRIQQAGKYAVLIGMENAYPIGAGKSFKLSDKTIDQNQIVEELAEIGVRYVGLTHFGHNQFGNGLSPSGRALVDQLNKAGIMVDVSHIGKETMMQAADLSRAPARNLDDEQLRKIAEVNGVAQMVALGSYVKLPTAEQQAARDALDAEFGDRASWDQAKRDLYGERRDVIKAMAPEASVANFVDHIDHAVKIAGIDHVGIASDFDGGGGIDGWQDASETLAVTAELARRGYSETNIGKIWGGNLLRVMEAVEAEAGK